MHVRHVEIVTLIAPAFVEYLFELFLRLEIHAQREVQTSGAGLWRLGLADGVWTPVLMLTARDAVPDRVSGLDAGADDYVPKPFAITELMARVRSLLRRSRAPEVRSKQRDIITFDDLTLDPGARTVFRGDREIFLTAKQFDLLAALMEHPNQVMSYDTVMQRVWGGQFRGESNVLAVTVSMVRKALEEGGEPRLIQTVRGVGYVLRQPKGKAAAAA